MKKNKGITLIPLIILIVVMLMLLGISIKVSRDILEKSKGEKLLAYMKLIELRANAYYEELDFEIGAKDFETYLIVLKNKDEFVINHTISTFKKMEPNSEKIAENCVFLRWDKNKLAKQGIDNTFLEKDDEYIIIAYNYNIHKVENVYYNKGIYLNEKTALIYSLKDLEKEMSK